MGWVICFLLELLKEEDALRRDWLLSFHSHNGHILGMLTESSRSDQVECVKEQK